MGECLAQFSQGEEGFYRECGLDRLAVGQRCVGVLWWLLFMICGENPQIVDPFLGLY
jgi:hypothetical protein